MTKKSSVTSLKVVYLSGITSYEDFFVAKLIGSFPMNHVVKIKISKACLISVVIFYEENKRSELTKLDLLGRKEYFRHLLY